MKRTYYLAIDMGASSGRHILGWMEDGKLQLEEVYRFENGMKDVDGHKCWDSDALFASIKAGMKKCAELGKVPEYMGIDTWGVDFVLLDKQDKRIGNAVGYRDSRTQGMDDEVYKLIPDKELYQRTGIQKALYNSIYQLMAVKLQEPEQLALAETLLMTPDYYNFLLTGVKCTEYTIATTTQLINPKTRDWDFALIERLGFPEKILTGIKVPGSVLASLSDEVCAEVGFNCMVVTVPSHDTASAVLSVPFTNDESLYISSGTWSLMGAELKEAICTEESRRANLTNEGGYANTYRFLKNIMGLWMIQSVRHELNDEYSFTKLCGEAEKTDIASLVDVDDERFFAPESMIRAVKSYCRETNQQVPESVGEITSVIYRSLAEKYARTVEQIENITGRKYSTINIVGGGCNADYLNRLTAKVSGRTVLAGPGEGTAIGNIVSQMLCSGELESIHDARKCVLDSFDVGIYQ